MKMDKNKLLIRFGLAVLVFWFFSNVFSNLTGGNQNISLEKALFVIMTILIGTLVIRIAIDFISIFWGILKDVVKGDKE